jgi:hypothetical protein
MIDFYIGYRCRVKRTNKDAQASKFNNRVPQAHCPSGKF